MDTEPIRWLEAVRAVALILGAVGITITDDEAQVIAGAIAAGMLAVSAVLSIIARRSVYSRRTVATQYQRRLTG
jgi:hypothetical protein